MPNSIKTREGVFEMTPDYLAGALAARFDTKRGTSDGKSKEWLRGYWNDTYKEHLRFGQDLINLPDEGTLFEIDPSSPWCGSRQWSDAGQLAMMTITGTLEAAKHLTALNEDLASRTSGLSADEVARVRSDLGVPDISTPARLRNALHGMGFAVSTDMCELVRRRIYFERTSVGVPLTDEEISIVEAMKEPRQNLVRALGYIATTFWTGSPLSKDVAWRARKSHGWVATTTSKMAREGERFLVSHSPNGYIWLTDKGWTAYRHLEAMRLEQAPAPSP